MTEFYINVDLIWSSGEQEATEEDALEALRRSGITVGSLIGECMIQSVEHPEEA